MSRKVYRVERRTASGYWYEVMLSPFLRVMDAGAYIDAYEQYYPEEDQAYRVLDEYVDKDIYRRVRRDNKRMLDSISQITRRRNIYRRTKSKLQLGNDC